MKVMILYLFCIGFLFSGCKDVHRDAAELIAYSVLDEKIDDIPAKAQVKLNVLLTSDSIKEQQVTDLLQYLYEQVKQKTGFRHHNHPTNIYIYAYSTQEKAASGMGQWVGMIAKSFDDSSPMLTISEKQMAALNEKKENKWGLSHEQRKAVWKDLALAERKAQHQADQQYPLDKPNLTEHDMKSNVALMEKLKTDLEKAIAKQYNIQEPFLDSISLEGVRNGWAFPQL